MESPSAAGLSGAAGCGDLREWASSRGGKPQRGPAARVQPEREAAAGPSAAR